MNSVFISYVRENKEAADRLYRALKSGGIDVWIDWRDLEPGDLWEDKIRQAIQEGAFFISCFSKEYNNRVDTYMNRELDVAIEVLKDRSFDQKWYIPVKLNECKIPDYEIGRGKTLRSFQHVDLSENWDMGIQRICKVIHPESCLGDANAYYNRGTVYVDTGDYDRAIQNYNTAIDLDPEYTNAYYNRGTVYVDTGDYDRAIQDYNTVITLDPEYANAYYNRGTIYANKGVFDAAIDDYSTVIDLNPEGANAYYNRGKAWLHRKEWEKAKADLTTAKDKGIDIVASFRNDYESVEVFEEKNGVEVPADIAALLNNDGT